MSRVNKTLIGCVSLALLGLIATTVGFGSRASGADLAALKALPTTAQQPAVPSTTVDPALRSKVINAYGKMPLAFEANQGQADPRAKFLSRGQGYEVFLTPTEAVLGLRVPEKRDDKEVLK